jgi:hypothetical protein
VQSKHPKIMIFSMLRLQNKQNQPGSMRMIVVACPWRNGLGFPALLHRLSLASLDCSPQILIAVEFCRLALIGMQARLLDRYPLSLILRVAIAA